MANPEQPLSEKEQAFLKLQELDQWQDEIPDKIIRGWDEEKNFKVRGNWFQAIISNVDEVLYSSNENDLDVENSKRIREIMEYFCSERFHLKLQNEAINESDIALGNELIKLAQLVS